MFLHEEEHIRYIHFDMARSNKRTTNVMAKLGDIGKQRSTTVWKFHDFSITQILREINFGAFRSSKNAIFCNYGDSEF